MDSKHAFHIAFKVAYNKPSMTVQNLELIFFINILNIHHAMKC